MRTHTYARTSSWPQDIYKGLKFFQNGLSLGDNGKQILLLWKLSRPGRPMILNISKLLI